MSSAGGQYDAAYKETGAYPATPAKKPLSKWVKFGVPVAVIAVIVGAVVGGVLGSRAAKNKDDDGGSGSAGSSSGNEDGKGGGKGGNGGSGVVNADARYATATDSEYLVPIYPSATDSALFSAPTFAANAQLSWPEDPFRPSSPSPLSVRPERPRLIAPQYKWDALPNLIRSDPYMRGWNDTIFMNATQYMERGVVPYFLDGGSGILDVAREVKQRIKAFGYAYRISRDTRWSNQAWLELQNAAGEGSSTWTAEDKWNPTHFLDAAELSAAYGIAYDWFYDIFNDEQKTFIRSALIQYGLRPGVEASTTSAGWWREGTNGNWNCVCNGGLTIGALAILNDDDTGVAEQLLGLTIDNAKENCVLGPSDDGTWAETKNYWYFGATGHAEMASALLTATGSDYGLLSDNPGFALSGLAHMHGFGPGSLFDYGDHGPNKFSATANSIFLHATAYNRPEYALFQREQFDAAEPWGMLWYNPAVKGAFWSGHDLDHFFDNQHDQWAAMRSSWTDNNALYVAIKAGQNQDHQAHNDLDVGTFVLDALGTRWAGELGSADYLAPGYFESDAQDAERWLYYRKMTAGQNTILIGQANQNVAALPSVRHGSSETKQGPTTVFDVPDDSTAFWTTDMTSAYFDATTVKRGVRMLNKRRQVLLQDEVAASEPIQWRMHTNATVEADGTSATLTRDGQTMQVSLLSPPEGASFSTAEAVRFESDPTPPAADQPNPGVTVLVVSLPAGTHNLQVLFNPRWPGMDDGDFVTPPTVALDDWSLTSHD